MAILAILFTAREHAWVGGGGRGRFKPTKPRGLALGRKGMVQQLNPWDHGGGHVGL